MISVPRVPERLTCSDDFSGGAASMFTARVTPRGRWASPPPDV
jgi:hypothetical protein